MRLPENLTIAKKHFILIYLNCCNLAFQLTVLSVETFIFVSSSTTSFIYFRVVLDAGELTSTLESMKTPSEFSSAGNFVYFV